MAKGGNKSKKGKVGNKGKKKNQNNNQNQGGDGGQGGDRLDDVRREEEEEVDGVEEEGLGDEDEQVSDGDSLNLPQKVKGLTLGGKGQGVESGEAGDQTGGDQNGSDQTGGDQTDGDQTDGGTNAQQASAQNKQKHIDTSLVYSWEDSNTEKTCQPKRSTPNPEFDHPPNLALNMSADRDQSKRDNANSKRLDLNGGEKTVFQSATGIDVLKPDFSSPTLRVRTNHFRITIGEPTKDEKGDYIYDGNLYVYRMRGIDTNITRAKKRTLMQSAIDNCYPLLENQEYFVTDYMSMIVSNCDLFVGEVKGRRDGVMMLKKGEKLKEGDVVAHIEVENHDRRTHQSDPLQLTLVYERAIPLISFKDYVYGRNPEFASVPKEMNDAIHALNLMIGKWMSESNDDVFRAGKDRFFLKNGWATLKSDPSKVAFRGYSYTTRATTCNLLLNFNTATSVFYRPMSVAEYLNIRGNKKADLIGVRVWVKLDRKSETLNTNHARIKTISEVGGEAGRVTFEVTDSKTGKTTRRSVLQHMKLMKYPTGGSTRSLCVNTNPTASAFKAWFLAEDLQILPFQLYKRKIADNLTSDVIKLACRHPEVNANAIINEGLPALGIAQNMQSKKEEEKPAALLDTGVRINHQMLTVPARYATVPGLRYAQPGKLEPLTKGRKGNYGMWKIDANTQLLDITTKTFSGKPAFFLIPKSLKTDGENQLITNLNLFYDHYSTIGPSGLGPAPAALTKENCKRFSDDWESFVDDLPDAVAAARATEHSIIVMILPKNNRENQKKYCAFKALMEQTHGEVTLCLSAEKLQDNYEASLDEWTSPSRDNSPLSNYCRNVALKLNIRLGNVNHTLTDAAYKSLPDTSATAEAKGETRFDTIILGADVIHPGATAVKGTPSIAAVVGSIDEHFAKYLGSMRRQKYDPASQSKEIIDDAMLKSMVMERLNAWADRHNGRFPTNIIYYRDGVGDSQFRNLRTTEIKQIRDAFEEVTRNTNQRSTKCKVTAVVVTKRHNVRFYPEKDTETSSTGNCHAGTVVDQAVTTPYNFDFYLLSHHGLHGTSRPAHYFVVENDIGFGMKTLQDFTFALCHLYQRSTTSVGYATPAYYADHLCERGRAYVREFFDGAERVADMDEDEVETELDEAWGRGGRPDGNPWRRELDDKMFWL